MHSKIGELVDLDFGYSLSGDKLISIENVTGSKSSDYIYGDSGDNRLTGLDGNDVLMGRSGDDRLEGNAGGDKFYGGSGDDILIAGVDSLRDTFYFSNYFGNDVVTEFDPREDRIDLQDVSRIRSFNDLRNNHLSQIGNDTVISDGEDTIMLIGVDILELSAGGFVF